MVEYKFRDCCGILEVIVNGEPENLFEHEENAWEFLEERDGDDVAEVYYSSKSHLLYADGGRFIGYGVIKDGEVI